MTASERKSLAERIEAADALERRIRNLKDASRKLQDKTVAKIKIPLSGGRVAIEYSNHEADDRFFNVCWANCEEGLVDEIYQAVLGIIDRRLTDANAAYELL